MDGGQIIVSVHRSVFGEAHERMRAQGTPRTEKQKHPDPDGRKQSGMALSDIPV